MARGRKISDVVVVDTSVIVKWLSSHNELWLEKADLLLKRVEKGEVELRAPVLAKYEAANAIRYKALGVAEKLTAVQRFYDLPIEYFDVDERQAETVLSISLTYEMAYYDATFLELAQRTSGILVTADAKDQGKCREVKVVDLRDYA